MNLSNIITLYHSGQLLHMVYSLEQCEEILLNAEYIAFEAWRTNTNPTTCLMLEREQQLYQKIQLAIRKKLGSTKSKGPAANQKQSICQHSITRKNERTNRHNTSASARI